MTAIHPDLEVIMHSQFEMEPLRSKDPFPVMRNGCRQLERLGVRFWMAAGSVLGLRREAAGFIAHDTDVDVEVRLSWDDIETNSRVRNEIIGACLDLGWRFIREMRVADESHPSQLAFIDPQTNIIFDIYFFYEGVEDSVLLNYNDCGVLRQESRYFDVVEPLAFGDDTFPVPSPVDEYLVARYGTDWSTPRAEKRPWNEDAANLVNYRDE